MFAQLEMTLCKNYPCHMHLYQLWLVIENTKMEVNVGYSKPLSPPPPQVHVSKTRKDSAILS